ncbi:MAG: response regulator transcription factor [Bacteroidetes bacterium]|nr:response regulator transcription factor [Bacteroidota bacterium]
MPDIIISDVMMPKKDGYEVCAELKQDEPTSHIPIILLTAKATFEDRITGLEKGADAYLTKPFAKEELFIRLQKLVEIHKTLQKKYASSIPKKSLSNAQISIEEMFLVKARQVVENHFQTEDFNIHQFCRQLNMSRTQVHRKVKALTGRSTSAFIRTIRLQKAKELVQNSELTISEIAYEVGFRDPNYFSRTYLEEFGEQPSETRK